MRVCSWCVNTAALDAMREIERIFHQMSTGAMGFHRDQEHGIQIQITFKNNTIFFCAWLWPDGKLRSMKIYNFFGGGCLAHFISKIDFLFQWWDLSPKKRVRLEWRSIGDFKVHLIPVLVKMPNHSPWHHKCNSMDWPSKSRDLPKGFHINEVGSDWWGQLFLNEFFFPRIYIFKSVETTRVNKEAF